MVYLFLSLPLRFLFGQALRWCVYVEVFITYIHTAWESDSPLLWRWNILPVNDTTQSGLECGLCRASRFGSHCQERRWDENVEIRAKVRKAGEEAKLFFFSLKPYDRHQCYEKRSNTQFQRFSKVLNHTQNRPIQNDILWTWKSNTNTKERTAKFSLLCYTIFSFKYHVLK